MDAALDDPAAAASRRQLARELANGFQRTAVLLSTTGTIVGGDRAAGRSPFGFGDDATVGLGTVFGIAGEIISGAHQLLISGNVYSAAALIRQLVEVEYLTWAFSSDDYEARQWLRSSADERRQLWQPRHLRDRADGRFRGTDYGYHCELGGHPTPSAVELLPDAESPQPAERWWFDLVAHGASAWRYGLHAIEKLGSRDYVPEPEVAGGVQESYQRWEEADGLVAVIKDIRQINQTDSSN